MNQDKKDNISTALAISSIPALGYSAKSSIDKEKALSAARNYASKAKKSAAAGIGATVFSEGAEIARDMSANNSIRKGKPMNRSLGNLSHKAERFGPLATTGFFMKGFKENKKAKEMINSANKSGLTAKKSGIVGASLIGASLLNSLRKDKPIEKKAARAWKKNFGDLSDASKELLQKSDILNHKRELTGLNKGTANILKKNDVQISTGEASNAVNEIKNIVKGKKDRVLFNPTPMGVNRTRSDGSTFSRVFLANNTKDYDNLISGVTKGTKMNKVDKDYLEAMVRRHEADEIRVSKKIAKKDLSDYKKGKKRNYGEAIGDSENTLQKSMSGSHVSPEVIHRESATMAIAPKHVKEAWKKARSNSPGFPLAAELDEAGKYGLDDYAEESFATGFPIKLPKEKLDYGKSAVINKKLMKRDKKDYAKAQSPRDFMGDEREKDLLKRSDSLNDILSSTSKSVNSGTAIGTGIGLGGVGAMAKILSNKASKTSSIAAKESAKNKMRLALTGVGAGVAGASTAKNISDK